MNEYRFIEKIDKTVTLKFNEYTFLPDGESKYIKHYGHNIELSDFTGSWYCHTCLVFWDQSAATEYVDYLYRMNPNNPDLYLGDTHTIEENWGDY